MTSIGTFYDIGVYELSAGLACSMLLSEQLASCG